MNHSVKDISVALAGRAEAVCRHLLPSGKIKSGEWCVGDIHGSPGDSLKVHLSGQKAGVWKDFAGDDAGDLLDLWAAVGKVSMRNAIQEAKRWLGIVEPESFIPKKKYAKCTPAKPLGKIKAESEAMSYLTETRKVSRTVLDRYKVGETETEIAFPSYSVDGELLNVKYIGIVRPENGKKSVRQEKDCAPCLFGWQSCGELKDWSKVIITEGQIDAMTWHQWSGFPSLSVPNGTGDTHNWIDFEWENLILFEKIYLSFDMDEPGKNAVQIVAKRLGIEKCFIVELPHKDANECLLQGMDLVEAERCLVKSKAIIPKEIKTPLDFLDKVLELAFPELAKYKQALEVSFLSHSMVFRRGELTIWTGHASHGKSSLLNQFIIQACMAGELVALGSFEMKPETNIWKMCIAMSLIKNPTLKELEFLVGWLTEKLWIYNKVGRVEVDKLMELINYSVRRHGVTHFIIDSLMKCEVKSDDWESQRSFVDRLQTFAIQNDVHIHLVAHTKKDKDESQVPGMYDISGGAQIGQQADNVISVWRNKKKELAQLNGRTIDEPDCQVAVRKQRNTGDEPWFKLRYSKEWNRYARYSLTNNSDWEDYKILPPTDLFSNEADNQDDAPII